VKQDVLALLRLQQQGSHNQNIRTLSRDANPEPSVYKSDASAAYTTSV